MLKNITSNVYIIWAGIVTMHSLYEGDQSYMIVIYGRFNLRWSIFHCADLPSSSPYTAVYLLSRPLWDVGYVLVLFLSTAMNRNMGNMTELRNGTQDIARYSSVTWKHIPGKQICGFILKGAETCFYETATNRLSFCNDISKNKITQLVKSQSAVFVGHAQMYWFS